MQNQKCEFTIQLCSSKWRIVMPASWSDSFLVLMGQILADKEFLADVELDCYEMDETVRSRFEAIRENLPLDVILFRNEGDLQHFITSQTWSIWNEKELKGTFWIKEKHDEVLLGTNLFSHFFIWASKPLSYMPVHASCFGFNETYALMPASARRGKSTLTFGAYLHGFDILADDFCFLMNQGQQVMASGPYASIKLNQDSIDMGLGEIQYPVTPHFFEKDDAKKVFLPSRNGGRPFAGHGTVKYIFVPRRDSHGPGIEQVNFCRVLPHLSSSYQLVRNAKGDIKSLFGRLNTTLKSLPVFELSLGESPRDNVNFLRDWWPA